MSTATFWPGRHIPPAAFGPMLRAARQAAGLSLRAAAWRCRISFSFLAAMERGEKSPSQSTAGALISVLGITGEAAEMIRACAITGAGRDFPR